MADLKITGLGSNTTPAEADVLAIVDDPAGTPVTQKITYGNLMRLTIRGDMIYRNATVPARLAVGAATTILQSDGIDPGWVGVGTKVDFTFATGWSNYGAGFSAAEYWKDPLGVVHLQGFIKYAGGGTSTITTLPAGYRPAASHYFAAMGNDVFATVAVNSAGAVLVSVGSGSTYLSLAGMTFYVV